MNSHKNSNLFKKVYFTVLYLNCLKHPPTTFEVWRHFLDISQEMGKVSFLDVYQILQILERENKIFNKKSFWGITNKNCLAEQRIIRQKNTLMKTKRLKKWIKVIQFLPFIRGIFLTGTLALRSSSQKSDWDVLVIIKKNRIWLGRLILTVFLFLLGKKRIRKKIKNRFCLNHFLAENCLIPEKRNEYTASEFGFMYPALNQALFNDFARLNWNWQRRFNPNFEFESRLERESLDKNNKVEFIRNLSERILDFLGADFLNQVCKKWMSKKIKKNPKTNKEGAVIIYNDGELAFWPDFKSLNKIVEF